MPPSFLGALLVYLFPRSWGVGGRVSIQLLNAVRVHFARGEARRKISRAAHARMNFPENPNFLFFSWADRATGFDLDKPCKRSAPSDHGAAI